MAITKSATEFLKESCLTKQASTPIGRYLTPFAKKLIRAPRVIGKGIKWTAEKPGRFIYTKGVRPALHAGLNTANYLGKKTVEHPKRMLPAMVLGGVGLFKAKDRLNRNILHADPNTDVTMYRPRPWFGEGAERFVPSIVPNVFDDVRYKTPAAKAFYSKQDLVF